MVAVAALAVVACESESVVAVAAMNISISKDTWMSRWIINSLLVPLLPVNLTPCHVNDTEY